MRQVHSAFVILTCWILPDNPSPAQLLTGLIGMFCYVPYLSHLAFGPGSSKKTWRHQHHPPPPPPKKFWTRKPRCGSDGSFVPHWIKGSFAWRIESEDGQDFIEGEGIFPGPPEAQCSFCSEVGGVSGIVHKVTHLETLASPAPILLTGCDSISTLHHCMSVQHSVKARWSHCDLLSNLQAPIHLNTSTHAWMHVKAHQTRTKIRSQLLRNALLNEDMDALATKIMEAFLKAEKFETSIGMPSIHCRKIWIACNIKQSLYQLLRRQPVQAYLEDRKVVGHGTYDLIDWVTICKAQGSNHNWDLQRSKVISNQLPTLQILYCRKHVISDKCLFCTVAVEDMQHIYRCTHTARQDQWKEQLQRLARWLQDQSTEPGLQKMLIIMSNW